MSLAPEACSDDRPAAPADITSSTVGRGLTTDPHDPPGVQLRCRREERGLTIEDLWRTTKINKATLRALEASDVLHLPAAIYTRGFVKAYAREVGLDPDSTADEYLRRIEPMRAEHLLVDDGQLPPLADHITAFDANDDARSLLAANQVRRFSRVTFALAVMGLVAYIGSFYRGDAPATDATTTPAPETRVDDTEDAARVVGDPSDAAIGSDATLGDAPLRVELVPRGPCWLSARVDGQRVVSKLLQAGERHTLDVMDEAVLRVGEPGALSFSINGQSGRPLGPAGQPITVRITKDNFRDFLSS
jgi:hypothetical protein